MTPANDVHLESGQSAAAAKSISDAEYNSRYGEDGCCSCFKVLLFILVLAGMFYGIFTG